MNSKAFTLVELLVSVALLALLLVSIAAAVSASLQSASENELLGAMTQSARAVMDRITRDIRTAAAVETTSTTITIIPPVGSGIDQIQYEISGVVLYYRQTISGETTTHILIGDPDEEVTVASFSIASEMGQDWQGLDCAKSVTLTLELAAGNNRLTVTGSASPRRNQTY